MIDIRMHTDILELINDILAKRGIAEVKCEGKENIVVVEINRTVKTKKPPKSK